VQQRGLLANNRLLICVLQNLTVSSLGGARRVKSRVGRCWDFLPDIWSAREHRARSVGDHKRSPYTGARICVVLMRMMKFFFVAEVEVLAWPNNLTPGINFCA